MFTAASLLHHGAHIVGDNSSNMGAVLPTALSFATADRRELLVDIEALVSALLTARTAGGTASAATWLQYWARDEGLTFTLRQPADAANLAHVLSRSVVGSVVLRAVQLRDRAISGELEPFSLRHLMFALAERQAAQWPPLRRRLPECTPLLSDSLANIDKLGRKPLVDALAARLVQLQQD